MQKAVVIPQRGHDELTLALLRGIRVHEGEIRVVVVNDHPQLDVDPEVRRLADMVLSTAGAGVTAAWNMGVSAIGCGQIVLLNNDVLCQGPFCEALMHPGAISGATLRYERDLGGASVLAGWCLSFNHLTWSHLGGFDERLVTYFSDTAFQAAALRQGLKLIPVPVPLLHLGHRTAHDPTLFPEQREAWRRDRKQFLETWGQS